MNRHREICPHCGGHLEDFKIEAGDFTYSQADGFRINDRPWTGSKQTGDLMCALMQARGAPLTAVQLAQILQTSANDARNLVKAQIYTAKQKVATIGIAWPVSHRRGDGWYWSGPQVIVVNE